MQGDISCGIAKVSDLKASATRWPVAAWGEGGSQDYSHKASMYPCDIPCKGPGDHKLSWRAGKMFRDDYQSRC